MCAQVLGRDAHVQRDWRRVLEQKNRNHDGDQAEDTLEKDAHSGGMVSIERLLLSLDMLLLHTK